MIRQRAVMYLRSLLRKERRSFWEQLLVKLLYWYRDLKVAVGSTDHELLSKLYLRYRNIERNIAGETIFFVSFVDLAIWIREWVKCFPINPDIVVGIPRSGLLVANMLALKLGKPLTTPELLCQGRYWMTTRVRDKDLDFSKNKKILLVDDIVGKGRELRKALQLLHSHGICNISTAALIVTEEGRNFVDFYYKESKTSIVLFEWNLLHAKKGKIAVDLDGVLCTNCPKGIDADEQLYVEWIRTAKPYLIPAFEIDAIVSCRLERYRAETEKWLIQHGVRYKELILWDLPSKQEREGKYAEHKIRALLRIKPDMFWESNFEEAKQIWTATGIPTLCIDEMILFSK